MPTDWFFQMYSSEGMIQSYCDAASSNLEGEIGGDQWKTMNRPVPIVTSMVETVSVSSASSQFEQSGQFSKSLLLLQDDNDCFCESKGNNEVCVVDGKMNGFCSDYHGCANTYTDCGNGSRSEFATYYPDHVNQSVLAMTRTYPVLTAMPDICVETPHTACASAVPKRQPLIPNSPSTHTVDLHFSESVCSGSSSDTSISTPCSDEPSGSNSVSSLIGDAAQTVYDHDMLSFDYRQAFYGTQSGDGVGCASSLSASNLVKVSESEVTAISHNADKSVSIGSYTVIPMSCMKDIDWSDPRKATKRLALAVFGRETLATHSLTGSMCNAHAGKTAKPALDSVKVDDITAYVTHVTNCPKKVVRSALTSACNDATKSSVTYGSQKRRRTQLDTSSTQSESKP